MTRIDDAALALGFAIFCRIGVCLSFAPGFGSPRIPIRLRLLIALSLTVTLFPLITENAQALAPDRTPAVIARLIALESAAGAAMGILARLVFSALETTFTAASMAIGLTSSFAPRIDEGESLPELATLVAFATTALLFLTDLHWEIVRAIIDSYAVLPVGVAMDPKMALDKAAETLAFGFRIAFQLASPFIAFGLVTNFAFALLNKVTPQIAVYFVAAPLVLFAGLLLLSSIWVDISTSFLSAFGGWLRLL